MRRDRDGRDRARSRARDTSRPRRETSTKRDRDERDKDRDRTRDRRGDDRDDSRRERDDHRRGGEWDEFHNRGDRDREDLYPRGDRYRPRDAERDADDDPRRWRDDGKRDERLAARRERDRWDRHEERDRERPSEDSRPRRGAARDRRGANADEGKDREDRREKEAEPAWMETYVPTTPGGGILGGQGADGELDGIQAWKKGMKEKERQESEAATKAADDAKSTPASGPQSDGQLDEIQLFRLMMKRDAGKKESEQHQKENAAPPPVPEQSLSTIGSYRAPLQLLSLCVFLGSSAAAMNAPSQSVVDETQAIINRAHADGVSLAKAVTADGSQPLLSVLMSATTETVASTSSNRPTSVHSQPEGSRIFASRASTTLLPPPSVAAPAPLSNSSSIDALSNASTPSTFNPPTGSRLLAFGSRAPPGPVGPEHIPSKNITPLESPTSQFVPPGIPGLMPQKASMNPSAAHPNMMSEAGYANEPHFQHNGRHNLFEGVRMQRSFSPHSNMSQASGQFDDLHDIQMLGQMAEMRRASAADRAGLGLANDVGPPYGEIGPLDVNGIPGGPNHAANKMSRLSRLMDQKTREGPPPANRKMPAMPAFSPNPQMPDPRQANAMLNGGMNGNTDARTMEDIFAMLQSSAQVRRRRRCCMRSKSDFICQDHRASPQIPSGRIPSGGSPFGHSPADLLQQQIHQHQHYQQSNHLDSLYDSRMDDRFVPDGMVPGLRPALPRSRSREPSGVLFNEQLDDPLHFNARLQQQRSLDLYPTSVPNMYSQQPTMLRNGGLPMQQQQQQFRGNPSPMSNQNMLGGAPQRLPPGLANLGGRPPHDPSQYLGGPIGGMGGGIPGGIHAAQALQQAGYNNLGGGALGGAGLGGFSGGPQLRGPAPQNPLNVNSLNSMANLGLHNNLDLRAANQAQLLGMQGVMPGGLGGGLRGQPGYVPQHGPGQLPSQMSMRQQQQQQQLPSHLMPHMLPPHLSQQQGLPGGTAQGTQDLMALLLGGHRE